VAARVRHRDLDRRAGRQRLPGELRRPGLGAAVRQPDDRGRVDPVLPAEDPPGRVALAALALAGDDRVDEEAVDADHADAAAPLAGRARIVAQLVALGPHREAP